MPIWRVRAASSSVQALTIKLLRGGIRAWVNGQRPCRPMRASCRNSILSSRANLSPSRWCALARFAVDLNQVDGLPVAMGTAERIDAGGDAVRATDAIRRRQAELARMSAKERPNALVIVTRDEASATRLRDALRNGGGGDVLILPGGMAGYQAFLAQQQSSAAAAGKPLIRSCGSG
jgi:hypothetical protein